MRLAKFTLESLAAGNVFAKAKQILNFDLTLENVTTVLKKEAPDLREKAFQTILRNRVQRGGILADGAGLIKTGENGRGLNSRWYPGTLARRIREINRQKDRMTFVEGNGFDLIEEHKNDADAAFYIDPPYTIAARRLYKVWQIDHAKLFAAMAACRVTRRTGLRCGLRQGKAAIYIWSHTSAAIRLSRTKMRRAAVMHRSLYCGSRPTRP